MPDEDQWELFEEGAPFVRGSATSEAAAEEINEVSGALRIRVYELLCAYEKTGLADHEMQQLLAMNPSTQRPRRIELVNQGHVCDSGRTRPTPSGRQAVVWIVVKRP
jgi:hypothetical protein